MAREGAAYNLFAHEDIGVERADIVEVFAPQAFVYGPRKALTQGPPLSLAGGCWAFGRFTSIAGGSGYNGLVCLEPVREARAKATYNRQLLG